MKNLLNDTLQNLLGPIRAKRREITSAQALEVALAGTEKAQKVAQTTMDEIRSVVGTKYR